MKNDVYPLVLPLNRIPYITTRILNLHLLQLALGSRFRGKLEKIAVIRVSESDAVKVDQLTVLDFVRACSVRPRSSKVVCKWRGFGSVSIRLIDKALAEHRTSLCSLVRTWEFVQLD